MKYRTLKGPLNRVQTTMSIDHESFSSKNMKKEPAKSNYKDTLVIVFAWLITLSLVYLCYLKFKYVLR